MNRAPGQWAGTPDRVTTRATWIWLTALTVLAAVLRIIGLGTQCLWTDEAFTAQVVELPVADLTRAMANDTHPPLFFWLEKLVTSGLGRDEWALRLLPLIAGIGAVPMLFLLARELLDARTGLFAAAIYAIAPPMIWFAQEARVYTLFTLLVLTTTWVLVVAVRRGRWIHYGAYALLLATSLYAHYFAVFMGCAHIAIVGVLAAARDIERRAVYHWLLALGGAAVLWAPWLPTLAAAKDQGSLQWIQPATPGSFVAVLEYVWFGYGSSRFAYLVPGVLAFTAVALVGTVVAWPRGSRRPQIGGASRSHSVGLIVLAAAAVVPVVAGFVVSVVVRPIFVERYFLAFLSMLYVLVAHGLARRSRPVALLLMMVLALQLAPVTRWILGSTTKADWRGTVALLRRAMAPGEALLLSPTWERRTFDYYARGRPSAYAIEAYEAYDGELCRLAQEHPRVWLVWGTRDVGATTVHDRLAARWPRTAVRAIAGEIHGGYMLAVFSTIRCVGDK